MSRYCNTSWWVYFLAYAGTVVVYQLLKFKFTTMYKKTVKRMCISVLVRQTKRHTFIHLTPPWCPLALLLNSDPPPMEYQLDRPSCCKKKGRSWLEIKTEVPSNSKRVFAPQKTQAEIEKAKKAAIPLKTLQNIGSLSASGGPHRR